MVLEEARSLIASEDRWTKGWYAMNANGRSCLPTAPEAVCWCAEGALAKASGVLYRTWTNSSDDTLLWKSVRHASEQQGFDSPYELNDCSSHADVLRMLDDAIAWLKDGYEDPNALPR